MRVAQVRGYVREPKDSPVLATALSLRDVAQRPPEAVVVRPGPSGTMGTDPVIRSAESTKESM